MSAKKPFPKLTLSYLNNKEGNKHKIILCCTVVCTGENFQEIDFMLCVEKEEKIPKTAYL